MNINKNKLLELLEIHRKKYKEWYDEDINNECFTYQSKGSLYSVTLIINQIKSGLIDEEGESL